MDNNQEEWKDIEGYEGLYQISNYGNVKSISRQTIPHVVSNEYILKRRFNYTGDIIVTLYKKDQQRINVKVYELVARHFVENPEGKTKVAHKDKNILNNNKDNLAWID